MSLSTVLRARFGLFHSSLYVDNVLNPPTVRMTMVGVRVFRLEGGKEMDECLPRLLAGLYSSSQQNRYGLVKLSRLPSYTYIFTD